MYAKILGNSRNMFFFNFLQGDAGSPMIKYSNVAAGISSVVNINKCNHPVVFIKLTSYEEYINKLTMDFPCKQPVKILKSDRRKKNIQLPVPNENNKKQRGSDKQDKELPDMNNEIGSP